MDMKFKLKPNLISLLVLVFSILFVLWWTLPAITKGTSNINMMKHFDSDEGNVVSFYNSFYKSLFLVPNVDVAYPTGFYYLAGIYLFPYSLLTQHQDCYRVIAITFRMLNLLSVIFTLVIIYILALYVRLPNFFLSSLLLFLVFTHNLLWCSLTNRPHPLEIFLLFLSIYFAMSWIRNKNNIRYLYKCLLLAAFAFSVKYGGIFLIPPIFIFLIYYFFTLGKRSLFQFIQEHSNWITISVTFLIFFSFLFIFLFRLKIIPYLAIMTNTGRRLGISGLLKLKITELITLSAIAITFFGCFWFCMHMYIRKLAMRYLNSSRQYINTFQHFAGVFNAAIFSIFLIAILYIIVFVLCNLHFIIHPVQNFKAIYCLAQIEFSHKVATGNFIKEMMQNIKWIPMLFNRGLLGISGGIALIWYLIFELFYFKRDYRDKKINAMQRIFLWIYIVTNFMFLILFIKFQTHHYLLMITYLLFFLICYGASKAVEYANKKSLKLIFYVLFCIILFWSIIERGLTSFPLREAKINIEDDTGLAIGRWLEDNYDSETKIWKDSTVFYISPKFKNISCIGNWHNITDKFLELKRFNPDILVITSEFDSNLSNVKKIESAIDNGTLEGFQLIRVFEYEGLLLRDIVRKYHKIYVYAKINNKQKEPK